jgi:drug/metabolite transporter (DMT)-like permease
MSGVVAAAIAGVIFGVFQVVNRAALVEMDVLASTFIQLLASAAFMVVALLVQGTEGISSLSASSVANFALAGLIHFFGGWTLLNMSQKRLGAARTSPLLATTPLFGTFLAAVTLDEIPGAVPLAGVGLIVVGVYVTQLESIRAARVPATVGRDGVDDGSPPEAPRWTSLFGLGAAFSWALSPIFIRRGLEDVDDPILGVTIGVLAATAAFGLVMIVGRRGTSLVSSSRGVLAWKVVAGLLVGVATWSRWYALGLASVAAVLGLGLLTVPTVMVLAPVVSGKHLERITAPVVVGSAVVVAGALVLIVRG